MKECYLHAMGVETWRLRAPQAMRAYYCYTLFDAEKNPVCLLMADVTVQDEVELNLVQAIAKATRLHVVEGLQPAESANVLILLGPQVAALFFQNDDGVEALRGKVHQLENYSVIVSYSPAQLLADKSLKAATWKDVQTAMGILGIGN
ncbi:hypothetical protein [Candidiatus Paracoxiella cheracis]|uniref:hypothetical protein n=1 Tax=Candidiatus Paracoxiella cheracis TaxID=3405120 RepID=UPI003BF4FB0B